MKVGRYLREAAWEAVRELRSEISPSAAVLLLAIADRVDDKRAVLGASRETMAEWVGLDPKKRTGQLSRDLKVLREAKLLDPVYRISRRLSVERVLPGRLEAVLRSESAHERTKRAASGARTLSALEASWTEAEEAMRADGVHGARKVLLTVRAHRAAKPEENQKRTPPASADSDEALAPAGECDHPRWGHTNGVRICAVCLTEEAVPRAAS